MIYHLCNTDEGSSGWPILNYETFKVIGIHKGVDKLNNSNFGIFIKYPIEKFYEEMKRQGEDLLWELFWWSK